MEKAEYARKLAELDHLFSDDEAPPQPRKLWSLLAELTMHDFGHDAAALRQEAV